MSLALSEPLAFHAALAVASAHWAYRLRTIKQQNSYVYSETLEWQLEVLNLALPVGNSPDTCSDVLYHRGVVEGSLDDFDQQGMASAAPSIAQQSLNPNSQHQSELRGVAIIISDSWQTYVDGLQSRPDTIRKVRSALRLDAWSPKKSRTSLFLRAYIMWGMCRHVYSLTVQWTLLTPQLNVGRA